MARCLLDFIKRHRALYFFHTNFPCRLRCFPQGLAVFCCRSEAMSAPQCFTETRRRRLGLVIFFVWMVSKHLADVPSKNISEFCWTHEVSAEPWHILRKCLRTFWNHPNANVTGPLLLKQSAKTSVADISPRTEKNGATGKARNAGAGK